MNSYQNERKPKWLNGIGNKWDKIVMYAEGTIKCWGLKIHRSKDVVKNWISSLTTYGYAIYTKRQALTLRADKYQHW